MVGFCYVLVIEIEKFHNFHVFHNVKIARLKVPCPQSGFLKSVTVSQYIDLQGRYRAAGAAKWSVNWTALEMILFLFKSKKAVEIDLKSFLFGIYERMSWVKVESQSSCPKNWLWMCWWFESKRKLKSVSYAQLTCWVHLKGRPHNTIAFSWLHLS